MFQKAFFFIFISNIFLTNFCQATPVFPTQPDLLLTPGALCTTPDSYRYPAHIPYCERDVVTDEKWMIIE